MGRGESGLTIYVGEAGEKYSDPEDWRDLVLEGRLRADTLVAMRRGGELFHQRAGDAPELARLFEGPSEPEGPASPQPAPTVAEWTSPIAGSGPTPLPGGPAPVLDLRLDKAGDGAPEPADVRHLGPGSGASQEQTVRSSGQTASAFALFLRCLTRDFARVSGRAGRKEFWSLFLGQLILLVALPVLAVTSGTDARGELNALGVLLVLGWALFALYIVVPSVSVTIRRLHDLGASAWVLLVVLVPYIGGLLLLVAAALPSQRGANQFGPGAA